MLDRAAIYRRAEETYGLDYQLTVAVEELSELQKEVCKLARCEGNVMHLTEEIADVQIILAELMQYFHIGVDEVSEVMIRKLARLEQRITVKRGGLE